MTVSGASRFINSATLANTQGISASQPQLLGGSSLLEAGRRINRSGIGLSSSARALNNQFVSNGASQGTALFGLASGASLSAADLATQIKGLRASLPISRVSPEVLEAERKSEELRATQSETALREEAEKLVKNERGVSIKEYEERVQEQIRILKAKRAEQGDPVRASFRRGVSSQELAAQKKFAEEALERYKAEAKKRGESVDEES